MCRTFFHTSNDYEATENTLIGMCRPCIEINGYFYFRFLKSISISSPNFASKYTQHSVINPLMQKVTSLKLSHPLHCPPRRHWWWWWWYQDDSPSNIRIPHAHSPLYICKATSSAALVTTTSTVLTQPPRALRLLPSVRFRSSNTPRQPHFLRSQQCGMCHI